MRGACHIMGVCFMNRQRNGMIRVSLLLLFYVPRSCSEPCVLAPETGDGDNDGHGEGVRELYRNTCMYILTGSTGGDAAVQHPPW